MKVSAVECRSMSEYLAMESDDHTARIVIVDADALNDDLDSLLRRLRLENPDPSVIVLSTSFETAGIAAGAGVDKMVFKSDPPQRLLSAVERLRIRGEDAQ